MRYWPEFTINLHGTPETKIKNSFQKFQRSSQLWGLNSQYCIHFIIWWDIYKVPRHKENVPPSSFSYGLSECLEEKRLIMNGFFQTFLTKRQDNDNIHWFDILMNAHQNPLLYFFFSSLRSKGMKSEDNSGKASNFQIFWI